MPIEVFSCDSQVVSTTCSFFWGMPLRETISRRADLTVRAFSRTRSHCPSDSRPVADFVLTFVYFLGVEFYAFSRLFSCFGHEGCFTSHIKVNFFVCFNSLINGAFRLLSGCIGLLNGYLE